MILDRSLRARGKSLGQAPAVPDTVDSRGQSAPVFRIALEPGALRPSEGNPSRRARRQEDTERHGEEKMRTACSSALLVLGHTQEGPTERAPPEESPCSPCLRSPSSRRAVAHAHAGLLDRAAKRPLKERKRRCGRPVLSALLVLGHTQ